MKVYLVGPISGCSYEEASNWRETATRLIESRGHSVFNPMAGKDCLKSEDNIAFSYEDHLMLKSTHIFQADLHRIKHSDVLFCNLQNLKGYSIGSFFEIGYGYAMNKVIIIVTDDKTIAEHPFIKNSSFVVYSIEEGIKILEVLTK